METEFAHYIKTDEIIFKHARGMRDIIGREFHTFHEIYLFLGGEAQFITDRHKQTLTPGTLIIIPRESFHQFTSPCDTKYTRCVFNFGTVSELDGLIEQKLNGIRTLTLSRELLAQFNEVFAAAGKDPDSYESKIMAKALLARLLCTLKAAPVTEAAFNTLHPLVYGALSYINAHVREPIGVADVAASLHISPSYLMRIFKSDLHISVYRYITEKRLILAAGEIEKGTPPTVAAELAGFGDYSGFFKLYKKMFGGPPSAHSFYSLHKKQNG